MTCTHQQGDHVPELMGWVCGQCYTILESRPQRTGAPEVRGPAPLPKAKPQVIVWQAQILTSAQSTTLCVFLTAMARRLEVKGRLDTAAAFAAALDLMKTAAIPFGDDGHDWSRISAIDIADEDMAYWDADGASGQNA